MKQQVCRMAQPRPTQNRYDRGGTRTQNRMVYLQPAAGASLLTRLQMADCRPSMYTPVSL